MLAAQHKRQAPHSCQLFSQRITTLSFISLGFKRCFLSSACICMMPLISPGVYDRFANIPHRHTVPVICHWVFVLVLVLPCLRHVVVDRAGQPTPSLQQGISLFATNSHYSLPMLHIRYNEVHRAENWDDWPSRPSGTLFFSILHTPTRTKPVTLARLLHVHTAWLTWNTEKETTNEKPKVPRYSLIHR